MTHRHTYARTFVTLTLPDMQGRYELYQSFDCRCGESASCTSWARNTGRHLGITELQAPQAPGLLPIEPWAWAVPAYHLHHWSPALRCIECGWTYYAVLARAKAVREEAPCI